MIEAGASQVQEDTIVDAIEFAHKEIKKITAAISDLAQRAGKPKRQFEAPQVDEAAIAGLRKRIGAKLSDALDTEKHPKAESHTLVKALKTQLKDEIDEDLEDERKQVSTNFEILRERIFREQVIGQRRRPDGRAFDQVRPIWIEVGVLPRTHGSSIFTRGETQALVTTTLGTSDDMQRLER